MFLTACVNNLANNTSNTPTSNQPNGAADIQATDKFTAASGCKNIGVLLPESDSSARYEAFGRPLLQQEIKKALPGATIQYANANNDANTQLDQANAMLTKKACILVVDPQDRKKAAVIVQKAKASKVPVIAYDRLIQDPSVGYYVSFDNVRVGRLQGQYIVDQFQKGAYGLKPGATLVMINGSQTDNNVLQFRSGALKALQPLIDDKRLKLVSDQYVINWDKVRAQSLMQRILANEQNNIQIAYVANDDMATVAIAALRTKKLNGKVLVTGQDATLTGIQNILTGDQSMTVYKPIINLAQATARLVAGLSNGNNLSSLINARTEVEGGGQVPSILATLIAVDKTNVAKTVIADGFLTKEQICHRVSQNTAGLCN